MFTNERLFTTQAFTITRVHCIHFPFSVKIQILQDSSRASLPSGRRFTRRPPYNTSMTLICQIEAAGYSLSDKINSLTVKVEKIWDNSLDLIASPSHQWKFKLFPGKFTEAIRQTLLSIIWIFTKGEGDEIHLAYLLKSFLPYP